MNKIEKDLHSFNINDLNILASANKLNKDLGIDDLIKSIAKTNVSSIKKALLPSQTELVIAEDFLNIRGYTIKSVLGSGSFGKVYKACNINNECFAFKVSQKGLDNELFILNKINKIIHDGNIEYNHYKNITRLLNSYEEDYWTFYILQFEAMTMTCYKYVRTELINAPNKYHTIQRLFFNILNGIEFLHKNDIVHLDIKTENILIDHNKNPKINDFGGSEYKYNNDILIHNRATLYYIAPELLNKRMSKLSTKIDMWACGCVFAELLHQQTLFKASNETELLGLFALNFDINNMILLGEDLKNLQFFPLDYYDPDELSLLQELLKWNPSKRISASRAKLHKYFSNSYHQ
jgi:serine/threonine protein kinase